LGYGLAEPLDAEGKFLISLPEKEVAEHVLIGC
jgi:hypothetical protein